MIDMLLGVPGKLKSVYDHLTTYLSSTRAAKIDNLDAAISTRAAAATALSSAVWTNAHADKVAGSAQETSPLLDSPMSTAGFSATPIAGSFDYTNAAKCCASYATTVSTTDVTLVDITGSGVLNFLICSAGLNSYGYLTLIIDGITIFSAVSTTNNACVLVGVGSYNPSTGDISIDQIPFKTSLVIKHKAAVSSCLTAYKYRRTS